LIGYGSQSMATGGESLLSAGLGLVRLKLWGAFSFLLKGRRAAWYAITSRRETHPEDFKTDMATLFGLLRDGAIHPGRRPAASVGRARGPRADRCRRARWQDRAAALAHAVTPGDRFLPETDTVGDEL
jgi:hypothetical protein